MGDIHGCLTAFETLLAVVHPGPEDLLVTLGDYVDRGPDSKGVLERLLELENCTTLVPLLGNHDRLFLQFLEGQFDHFVNWLSVGGVQTLDSYGGRSRVPESHERFLRERCQLVFEPAGADVFFAHGSADPAVPLPQQSEEWLLWKRVTEVDRWHVSGKRLICGHTAQRSGLPWVAPHAVCLDTFAFGGGWLSCLDVTGNQVTQANEQGAVRSFDLNSPPQP
jgi:serine/threonine protein phosphatase 1